MLQLLPSCEPSHPLWDEASIARRYSYIVCSKWPSQASSLCPLSSLPCSVPSLAFICVSQASGSILTKGRAGLSPGTAPPLQWTPKPELLLSSQKWLCWGHEPGVHFLQSLLPTRSSLLEIISYSGCIIINCMACSVCCLEFNNDVCFIKLCIALVCHSTFSPLEEIDECLHVKSARSQTGAMGSSEPIKSWHDYVCRASQSSLHQDRGAVPDSFFLNRPSGCPLPLLLHPQSHTYTYRF